MTNSNNVFEDKDFINAGISAWNSLSILIEPGESTLFENPEEFKHFYIKVMEKLLTEEVQE